MILTGPMKYAGIVVGLLLCAHNGHANEAAVPNMDPATHPPTSDDTPITDDVHTPTPWELEYKRRQTQRTVAWVSTAMATAGLAAAAVLGFQARKAHGDADRCIRDSTLTGGSCPNADYEASLRDWENSADLAWGSAAGSGLLAALAVTLFYRSRPGGDPTTGSWSWGPGVGLSWAWSNKGPLQ